MEKYRVNRWNGWTQEIFRSGQKYPAPTEIEINGVKWESVEKHTQNVNTIQDMHNHHQSELRELTSEWTLPLVDAITIRKTTGINPMGPMTEDENRFVLNWVRQNRPHLVGDKFKQKRKLDLPSRVQKELAAEKAKG